MGEIVVNVDTHKARNKRDVYSCRCGAKVEKGARVFRLGDTNDPESMLGAAPGPFVCLECANGLPWTNEAEAEMNVRWRDFVPSVPDTLDLDGVVPRWFVKALKHSEVVRWAYHLGRYRGRNE